MNQVPVKDGETEPAGLNLPAPVDGEGFETVAKVPRLEAGLRGSEQTATERRALMALKAQTGGQQQDGQGRRWGRQTPALQPAAAPIVKTFAVLAAVRASENEQH